MADFATTASRLQPQARAHTRHQQSQSAPATYGDPAFVTSGRPPTSPLIFKATCPLYTLLCLAPSKKWCCASRVCCRQRDVSEANKKYHNTTRLLSRCITLIHSLFSPIQSIITLSSMQVLLPYNTSMLSFFATLTTSGE